MCSRLTRRHGLGPSAERYSVFHSHESSSGSAGVSPAPKSDQDGRAPRTQPNANCSKEQRGQVALKIFLFLSKVRDVLIIKVKLALERSIGNSSLALEQGQHVFDYLVEFPLRLPTAL